MKIPLWFQITEFDCDAISLINELVYLFDKKDFVVTLKKVFISIL